jgi:uncharacterized iron-regulated membrane protein
MKKVFKKIHLWLSIPFGIFITIVCLSGASLVFEKEITESVDSDTYFVKEVGQTALPLDELMETVSSTLPDSVEVTGVTISEDASRAYQVNLSKPRRASLYVNQYTGEITGKGDRLPFFDFMFKLHRWLLGSPSGDGIAWGKLIVGVSTLLLVIIVLTGLLIWLCNRNKPLTKSLKISFTKGWPRFWHDLHVAGGIYATIFLLACALTGLTWSFEWYRNGFYSLCGVEASAGHGEHGGRGGNHGDKGGKPEGLAENHGNRGEHGGYHGEHGGRPEGKPEWVGEHGGNHGEHGNHDGEHNWHHGDENPWHHDEEQSSFEGWQEVYEQLAAQNAGYQQIGAADGTATVVPQGRISLRDTDNYTFKYRHHHLVELTQDKSEDKSGSVRRTIYTIHVGSWGGMITRIITFIAALLGATLPITGYYLWIKRRKRKNVTK